MAILVINIINGANGNINNNAVNTIWPENQ